MSQGLLALRLHGLVTALVWCAGLVAISLSESNAAGQAQIVRIDPPPGFAGTKVTAISGDGSTVVGAFLTTTQSVDPSPMAFRWTQSGGAVPLGPVPGAASSYANSVSSDGNVVAVNARESAGLAHSWTAGTGGYQLLPPVPILYSESRVAAVSGDGQAFVGISFGQDSSVDWLTSTRWIGGVPSALSAPGPDCGQVAGPDDSQFPSACNADGSVIVGRYCYQYPGIFEAGWRALPLPSGSTSGDALAVSADGTTVVGWVGDLFSARVGVWRSGQFRSDQLFGHPVTGKALSVSPQGDAIAGSTNTFGSFGEAILWSNRFGWRNVKQHLESQGVDLTGWELTEAVGVTIANTAIIVVGNGVYEGHARGWIARLCADSDGDGLCDDWEQEGGGIDVDGDSVIDLDLHALGCDPYRKNILVELDAMQGIEIDDSVLEKLRRAFAEAPVPNPIRPGETEPGPNGIDLIIDASEAPIELVPQIFVQPGLLPNEYHSWRTSYFGTAQDRALPPDRREVVLSARKLAFRYGVAIVSAYAGAPLYGRAVRPGDDFIVSLGLLSDGPDRFEKQSAAIMHEFGHCLGLQHGGGDGLQAKPNYLSVMNYALIFPGAWNSTSWALDYSRSALNDLDERSLDEAAGLSSPTIPMAVRTPFGVGDCSNGPVDCEAPSLPRKYSFLTITPSTQPTIGVDYAGPAEYDVLGNLLAGWQCCPDGLVSTGVRVAQNLNQFEIPGFVFSGQELDRLSGHDDWGAITYAPVGKAIGTSADLMAFTVEPGCPTVEGTEWLAVTIPPDAENPVPGFGTVGGSNARTFVYRVPYIFGNGTRTGVLWKKNLDVAPYDARRSGESNGIVFDENGDLYWRSVFASAQTQSGVVKTLAADGSLAWVSPLPDGPNVQNSFTVPPIVGHDAVYCSRAPASSPTVYALDKQTGVVLWESAPLPIPVGLGMSLEGGVLYGVTKRTAAGFVYAFAISATDGTLLWTLPIPQPTDTVYKMNTTLLRRAGPNGGHMLYWMYDGNSAAESGLRALEVTPSSGNMVWTVQGMRSSMSHVLYNDRTESLYACHWADYGSAIESIDPRTGAVRWRARPSELGLSLNGGFSPCHVVRPSGTGLIFSGFDGDIWSLRDPGSTDGDFLPSTAIDWYYDGDTRAGEARSLALAIDDPNSGDQVFITATSSTADYPRRLIANRIDTTNPNGERLWEWQRPDDPSPNAAGNFHFRSLSVGPNGTLYYFDSEDGPHGSLIAVGVIPCSADFDGNGEVQVPDIFAFLSAWFEQDPIADLDGVPGIGVPDIFFFLSLWFTGCP